VYEVDYILQAIDVAGLLGKLVVRRLCMYVRDRLKVYLVVNWLRCFTVDELQENLVTPLRVPKKRRIVDYGVGNSQSRQLSKKAAELVRHLGGAP
jgi:hypothetical protein